MSANGGISARRTCSSQWRAATRSFTRGSFTSANAHSPMKSTHEDADRPLRSGVEQHARKRKAIRRIHEARRPVLHPVRHRQREQRVQRTDQNAEPPLAASPRGSPLHRASPPTPPASATWRRACTELGSFSGSVDGSLRDLGRPCVPIECAPPPPAVIRCSGPSPALAHVVRIVVAVARDRHRHLALARADHLLFEERDRRPRAFLVHLGPALRLRRHPTRLRRRQDHPVPGLERRRSPCGSTRAEGRRCTCRTGCRRPRATKSPKGEARSSCGAGAFATRRSSRPGRTGA